MDRLKRGALKCPRDKHLLHFHQHHGMRLIREIVPEKPKRPFYVYDAKCPECGEYYEVRK